MSQRYECEINSKLKEGAPEVYLGIPATGQMMAQLLKVDWENGDGVVVNSYKNWLVIKVPKDTDMLQCSARVVSSVDVDIKCRIKKKELWVEFPLCKAPHGSAPADVSITLAPDEDVNPDPDPPQTNASAINNGRS